MRGGHPGGVASADALQGTEALQPATVSSVLRAAAQKIEPRRGWTRGWFARDAHRGGIFYANERAVCFCMLGAIKRSALEAVGPDGVFGLTNLAVDAVEAVIGHVDITVWNDDPKRRKRQVLAALRKAADLAEADGALEAPSPGDGPTPGMNT
jgi:hypothetical protein